MEMMQFHPTGILAAIDRHRRPLRRRPRARARLYNALGEHMERLLCRTNSNAGRDVVSRSGYMEIMAGRAPSGGVLIDATHHQRTWPNTSPAWSTAAASGLRSGERPVEVSPSSHYHMGGIRIDVDCHTNIEGLFAAGEDAGGVHERIRLGGNGVSRLDCLCPAGDTMVEDISRRKSLVGKLAPRQCEIASAPLAPTPARTPAKTPFRSAIASSAPCGPKSASFATAKDMQKPSRNEIRERIKRLRFMSALRSAAKDLNPTLNLNPQPSTLSTTRRNHQHRKPLAHRRDAHPQRGSPVKNPRRPLPQRLPMQTSDWLKNIFMTPAPNGDFKRTFARRIHRLTPAELKEHRERAGLQTLPVIDDEQTRRRASPKLSSSEKGPGSRVHLYSLRPTRELYACDSYSRHAWSAGHRVLRGRIGAKVSVPTTAMIAARGYGNFPS